MPENVHELMRELRARLIDLEIQNEGLRKSREELEISKEMYSDFFDLSPVGYLCFSSGGEVFHANLTIARMVGVERSQLGSLLRFFATPADREIFNAHLRKVFADKQGDRCELRLKRRGGREFYVQMDSVFIEDRDAQRSCRTAVTNISERVRMQKALRDAREEFEQRVIQSTTQLKKANAELKESRKVLTSLPSKLIAAQEKERKRLADELHDSIGQTLAALKSGVETAIFARDRGDVEGALGQLDKFIPMLQSSIEETRGIYMGLRAAMLEEMGLIATLRWHCRDFLKSFPKIRITMETGLDEDSIPFPLKLPIFRIAQEALNNAAKHSGAERVELSLNVRDCKIYLIIADDGVGMDLSPILSRRSAKGPGLTGMKERAELSGGSFDVRLFARPRNKHPRSLDG